MSVILDDGHPGVNALQIEKRYGEERAKRLHPAGYDQFIDISHSPQHHRFLEDPWADQAEIQDVKTLFPDARCQMLILGAGLGGLVYAVRMIQAGVQPENIRIVDVAGGFGGTWYWNRYPGLHCDVESYSYLPLLEETGYVPKQRYSNGEEIRAYANLIAEKWGISRNAAFQTKAQKLTWDEEAREWVVELEQKRAGKEAVQLSVRADYVATVNGPLNWAKLPGVPGILDFKGDIFHASRWDYSVTGGSPSDPSLTGLKDKKVAIIGTGCTAVQVVPHLARWAKQLYVVQRTPSSVDRQDQRETDEEWFRKEVAASPGWQRRRMKNLHEHFTTGDPPAVNLIDDSWTRAPALIGLVGNPDGPKTMEEVPAYMKRLHELDLPRQNRIRKRVEEEVHDKDLATKLQAWYPSWCKRPSFHDEYLPTFNRDNVTLLDTEGKGAERITNDAIVVNGQSYPVDIIICATGFRAPFIGTPAEKANATIHGRNGVSITNEWARTGPKTQHGVLDYNFPNLFFSGPWQGAGSPNFLFAVDTFATHAAYILAEARRRAEGKKFAVSPTDEAAQEWSRRVMMGSAPNAAMMGCTPSYFNVEGALDRMPAEMQPILASSGLWGSGMEHFLGLIDEWRKEGNMVGIQVEV